MNGRRELRLQRRVGSQRQCRAAQADETNGRTEVLDFPLGASFALPCFLLGERGVRRAS